MAMSSSFLSTALRSSGVVVWGWRFMQCKVQAGSITTVVPTACNVARHAQQQIVIHRSPWREERLPCVARLLPHGVIDEHNVVGLKALLVAHVQRVDLVPNGAHHDLSARGGRLAERTA